MEVEGRDHVEEDFVLAVADSFASPGNCVCDGDGWAGLDLEFVGLLRYVSLVLPSCVSVDGLIGRLQDDHD